MPVRAILLAVALSAAAGLALAQAPSTYRCVGKDGKKYYGSTIPLQCAGMPIEQLSPQGTVIRRIDAQGDEAARVAKEAEAAKKREEDAIAREQGRRNRALLATYTSEKDIEEARARALAENDKAVKEVETRIADIKKRQAGYDKEMEFFQETPKAADKAAKGKPADTKPHTAPKPPPKLLEDIKAAQTELATQQNALETRKKEANQINAKYDEDKRRFLELTQPVKK